MLALAAGLLRSWLDLASGCRRYQDLHDSVEGIALGAGGGGSPGLGSAGRPCL